MTSFDRGLAIVRPHAATDPRVFLPVELLERCRGDGSEDTVDVAGYRMVGRRRPAVRPLWGADAAEHEGALGGARHRRGRPPFVVEVVDVPADRQIDEASARIAQPSVIRGRSLVAP
ncbi:MAG: hypothetical protein KatS3mg060_0291 [Dehalococcoidia bacterium]|nr:MAG: hypothetical protein KatS3mg060_0291 [Dehalococcoidia bacterium]